MLRLDLYLSRFLLDSRAIQINKATITDCGPRIANVLKEAGPLPYYALSSVLTAFYHDVPTLSLIQHILDYVLA